MGLKPINQGFNKKSALRFLYAFSTLFRGQRRVCSGSGPRLKRTMRFKCREESDEVRTRCTGSVQKT